MGWFKNIVGGSTEQLPNTCQVENKSIGDLAVVMTVMITMIHSPGANWLRLEENVQNPKLFVLLLTPFSSCC